MVFLQSLQSFTRNRRQIVYKFFGEEGGIVHDAQVHLVGEGHDKIDRLTGVA